MKVSTNKDKSTVRVFSLGLIRKAIMAASKTTISKEKALTSGLMVVYTKEIGSIIKWKARVFSNGKMDASMRVNTKTIRRVDRVFSLGLMGDHMTELGPMESRTVKVLIQVAQDRREKESG